MPQPRSAGPHPKGDQPGCYTSFSKMKRLLLWDFPRGSWQYDIIVALILAFIFFTPRTVFRDQPRTPNIVQLPAEEGLETFWFEPDLLNGSTESDKQSQAQQFLVKKRAKPTFVVRVQEIRNEEQELQGYMAFVKP
jgi:hypothetical protein